MALWSGQELSYCSNVHPGDSIDDVRENLQRFVSPVRSSRGLERLQVGLWLSEQAARELVASPSSIEEFSNLLEVQAIELTSLNGFPFGNFHQAIVKEKVYLPHWGDKARLDYTLLLAELLAQLLPEDRSEGTISTLPLGFASDWSAETQQQAEQHFAELLIALTKLEQSSGKRIRVCLEMEPGCVLETTPQLICFFTQTLPQALPRYGVSSDAIEQYLGACYDICHQAVMFEDIEQSLSAIHRAGIIIGKIQVSNAMRVPNATDAQQLLAEYAEPRYLHQLNTRNREGEQQFCVDLNQALADDTYNRNAEWRIHFHVPIQAEQLSSPLLSTTRSAIEDTCKFLAAHPALKPHLEVETYTWGVMPEALHPANDTQLINCIAEELNWLHSTLANFNLMSE